MKLKDLSETLANELLKNPLFIILFIVGIIGVIIEIKKLHKKHKKL